MNFDLNRLRILAAVARHGTMTGAADELTYTASAVSQQIKRLEAEVRAPVLERHPRGVAMTEAGATVVTAAEAIERQLRLLQNQLEDLAGARTGTLRLGIFPTFAASLLPDTIIRFRERHPGVELTIRSSRKAPLRQLLTDRDLDMALVWDYPWNREEDATLTTHDLMTDQTVLLMGNNHPLAGRTRIAMEDLRDESWVVRADAHPTHDVLTRCAEKAGFVPRVAVQANDYPEAQAMVAAGLGVMLCPALATQPLRSDLVIRITEDRLPARRIRTAHLAERQVGPAYHAMLTTMREVVEEMADARPCDPS